MNIEKYNKYKNKLTKNKNTNNVKKYLKKLIYYGGSSNSIDTKKLYKTIMEKIKNDDNFNIVFDVYTRDLKLLTITNYNNKVYYYDHIEIKNKYNVKDYLHQFKQDFFNNLKIVYIQICYINKITFITNKCEDFYGDFKDIPKN